jgi:hypothetical protein
MTPALALAPKMTKTRSPVSACHVISLVGSRVHVQLVSGVESRGARLPQPRPVGRTDPLKM